METMNLLWLEFCGSLIAVVQCNFFIKFTNKCLKKQYYIYYICFCIVIVQIELQLYLPSYFRTIVAILIDFLFVRYVLKCQLVVATIAVILVSMVNQLTEGFLVPLSKIWLDTFVVSPDDPAFVVCLIGQPILSLVICYFSYRFIIKNYCIETVPQKRYLFIVLAPLLLITLTMGMIMDMGYSTTTINDETGKIIPVFNDYQILCIAAAAMICMAAVLFAFKQLTVFIRTENQGVLLKQQLVMQKNYVKDMQERYRLTSAFRHDIKNHLLVLGRLLRNGRTEDAGEYLMRLEESANALSFSVHTGNSAIDALLSSKLGIAKQDGISILCDVTIPSNSSIDDFDFCIVFSNALDNAIKACEQCGTEKYIRLLTRSKGGFFMLEIENSKNLDAQYTKGMGLGIPNMRTIAEKYHGTIRIESTENRFMINILFVNLLH
jgi:uncharacterized protein YsxB (DUF464 family)